MCVQKEQYANWTALRAFYYDVLLLSSAYSGYAGLSFWVNFHKRKLMLLLLSPLFFTEVLMFSVILTGRSI